MSLPPAVSFLLSLSSAAAADHTLQVVFSAECNPLFDWHSVALFYSFETSGFAKTANITRLLACSEAEQKAYPAVAKDIGPTFIHRNLRDDPLVDETGYPSYNKPYSVMAWLEGMRPLDGMSEVERNSDEFILMMDADMVFREPVDMVALGAARGVVVSAEYTYLVGTETGFAERFIAKELVPRLAQVGGFHIFHREDLRLIAPKWLEYTKRVRAFAHAEPETFFKESMSPLDPADEPLRAVRQKQSKWHSEMYGYVFAAAEVGVTHHVRRDVMLYPGYQPWLGRGPNILHYGSDYTVKHDGHEVYFNKMTHTQLRLEQCPGKLMGAVDVTDDAWATVNKRDALCLEHLAVIDASFCHFYKSRAGCEAHQIPPACQSIGVERLTKVSRDSHTVFARCDDELDACPSWAKAGECAKNPNFMHSSCPKSCESCGKSLEELHLGADMHLGDWKYYAAQKATQEAKKAQIEARLHGDTATLTADAHAAAAAHASPPPPPPSPSPSPPPPPPLHVHEEHAAKLPQHHEPHAEAAAMRKAAAEEAAAAEEVARAGSEAAAFAASTPEAADAAGGAAAAEAVAAAEAGAVAAAGAAADAYLAAADGTAAAEAVDAAGAAADAYVAAAKGAHQDAEGASPSSHAAAAGDVKGVEAAVAAAEKAAAKAEESRKGAGSVAAAAADGAEPAAPVPTRPRSRLSRHRGYHPGQDSEAADPDAPAPDASKLVEEASSSSLTLVIALAGIIALLLFIAKVCRPQKAIKLQDKCAV